ncbi:hypothetical protein D3C78_1793100 [compost metagenome]
MNFNAPSLRAGPFSTGRTVTPMSWRTMDNTASCESSSIAGRTETPLSWMNASICLPIQVVLSKAI